MNNCSEFFFTWLISPLILQRNNGIIKCLFSIFFKSAGLISAISAAFLTKLIERETFSIAGLNGS